MSNFRPVNLLNYFSKIYENYINNHKVNSMSNYISPYVSAYRKGYNSQHVLSRLLEEWRQHLDNDNVAGGVFMDLSKAFDRVPHDLLIAKLAGYSLMKICLCIYILIFQIESSTFSLIMYTVVSKMLFLGYLKCPLSALHCLTVSLIISFISSIKLACIILLMITL